MSSATALASLRFTGERVIPGAVDPDLWNEHISRYRFASLLSQRRRVLDIGCGTGYGTELLAANATHSIGLDNDPETIAYASSRFARAQFVCASASALPFAARSFDLITAFEVIEHLEEWRHLLSEAARVLTPEGIFLVSTPNKSYYAWTRKEVGPNPFHVHEFELSEFKESLGRSFPFVQVLAQNRQEAIVIAGEDSASSPQSFVPAVERLAESHFFLALCSYRPLDAPAFAHVSSADNLLRERELYIESLKAELAEARSDHLVLLDAHHRLEEESSCQLKNARSEIDAAKISIEDLVRERELVKESLWLRLGQAIGIGPWSTRAAHLRTLPRSLWNALPVSRSSILHLSLYLVAPVFLLLSAVALAIEDLCFFFFGSRQPSAVSVPRHQAASIVIPNWNGRDLLEKYLPFLLTAISGNPENEILVVDNASSDDSVEFLRTAYSQIKVLKLAQNLGFAGAANTGVEQARNDIVVLLNNDMRVEPDFLAPLLENFTDPLVFAISSQIFLADRFRRREETGLTEVWWESGRLRVSHRIDPDLEVAYPCAYAGGGSSAFDRKKFLELGGFDSLFHPFYYEDTDLGVLAWKRGWKVFYQPASVVHHEHRGTIGKSFQTTFIERVVHQNALLYCWKNVHDWGMLASHLCACLVSSLKALPPRETADPCAPIDARNVFIRLFTIMKSRWKAKSLSRVSDKEAFRRPSGGYFRDRFLAGISPPSGRLNVLFASPYPVEPPVHGGAVFMKETLAPLSSMANVHLVSFLDTGEQLPQQQPLLATCASAQFLIRPHVPLTARWTLLPHAIREFKSRDFAWTIHRTIYLKNIDVVQLEYTILGQYAGDYRHIPCMLFEHDISFRSLWRRIRTAGATRRLLVEYLRMRLYEPRLLDRVTRVQVCSRSDADYLQRLMRRLRSRIDSNVRAAIDVTKYQFVPDNRQLDTLLFIGSFRHLPNRYALEWFVQEVFPGILRSRPGALLIVVGSDPPENQAVWTNHPNVRVLGAVPDIRIPLERYSVFICPILSGSGVRVKLLEAFASGIPAVSTTVGAEGLASTSGDVCEIADLPADFAASVLKLCEDRPYRTALAARARKMVERDRDSHQAVIGLLAVYQAEVDRMRPS